MKLAPDEGLRVMPVMPTHTCSDLCVCVWGEIRTYAPITCMSCDPHQCALSYDRELSGCPK